MMSKSITLFCVLMVVLAVGALGTTDAAATQYEHNTSAGGACKGANGLSDKFTYANNFLTNTAATDQYIVCQFQMDDDASVNVTGPFYVAINVIAGGTAGTVSCNAQEGYLGGGLNRVHISVVRSTTLAANGFDTLIWDTGVLTRSSSFDTLTMSCKVPAGFKMGLIEYFE